MGRLQRRSDAPRSKPIWKEPNLGSEPFPDLADAENSWASLQRAQQHMPTSLREIMSSRILGNEALLLKRRIAEAQRHYRGSQYKLAIDCYSQALELMLSAPADERRDVFLARSACYVAAGLPKEAVADADAAIELDAESCGAYFQKAEAYFSFGLFEQALVNYYSAYQRRPDIDKFRLGVQKAENAVLQAILTCVPGDSLERPFGVQNPSVEELREAVLTVQPENKQRCLCGCCGCDSRTCGDFAHEREACQCACSACVQHNLYRHGQIYDPRLRLYMDVAFASGAPQANSTTATPLVVGSMGRQTQLSLQSQQQPLSQPSKSETTRRAAVLNPLQEDQVFLSQLLQDEKLQKNHSIRGCAEESSAFIATKNNFWAQQGDATFSEKKPQRSTPSVLGSLRQVQLSVSKDVSGTEVAELDNRELLGRVLQKIQQSQSLVNQGQLQQALLIMQTVEKQAQQVEVDPSTDTKFVQANEKTKLLTDAYSLMGCIYWRLSQLDLALQHYAQALDQAYEYQLMENPHLPTPKKEQQLYLKQVAEQKALHIRALRSVYQCAFAQGHYQRALLVLQELREMDYVPYFKALDLEVLARCQYQLDPGSAMTYQAALECCELIAQESYEFKIRKKYQLKLNQAGVSEFNNAAPSWTGWRQMTLKDCFYSALWSLYYGALAIEEQKKAVSVLKDGLLLAERQGDQKEHKMFLEELRKYEQFE